MMAASRNRVTKNKTTVSTEIRLAFKVRTSSARERPSQSLLWFGPYGLFRPCSYPAFVSVT
jgi:hypothetical protein